MATLEKNVLMVKKERTDLILEYPITKMDNIVDMPDSFPPSTHTHDDRYFTETEMNAKLADKAGKVHTHVKADITDFPTALKNPTALTFTGGVTGSYDGSEAKTITIPSSLPASGGNADTVDGKHATDFASSVHTHTKASISDFPASMPASDVSAWAKQQTKPTYTKAEVGLANVTNDAQVKRAEMGVASGIATLDTAGKVPSSQLPSYVDDVLEYDMRAGFPTTGETGKIYVDKQSNLTYRWSGTAYVQISPSITLGETASTAYAGDKGKQATNNINNILSGSTVVPRADLADRAQLALTASTVPWTSIGSKPDTYPPSAHTHTKTDVGLSNVTNDAQVKRAEMGVANGVATLDTTGKVPASQLPGSTPDPEIRTMHAGGGVSVNVHKFKDGRLDYYGEVVFARGQRSFPIAHPYIPIGECTCQCTQVVLEGETFIPFDIGVRFVNPDGFYILADNGYGGDTFAAPIVTFYVKGYWKKQDT